MRRRYRLPMPPGQKAKLICFFLSVALLSLTIVGTNHLRSLLGNLAVTRVSNMVGRVVMEAVSDAVNSGEIQYNDLISLEKDADGGIAALQSNMAEFNRLQSAITKDILDRLGQMPLPPYITHELKDKNRYQTVYAKHDGSAAAPTAGLHFTKELLEEVRAMGVTIARVTLHVGLGTFRPVKVENILDHHMHSEFYMVEEEEAEKINDTRRKGGRIICVGTTSCRTVESAAGEDGMVRAGSGWTDIFIYPGYRFKVLDCLVTNLHLPESTLVMLVSALAGREHVLNAYEEAVKERYRFFSFGDAMFIY